MADLRPLVDSYPLYIDGRWVDPGGGRYDDISPSTEATIAQAPDAGLADVDTAISAARRAFDSGSWDKATPEERGRCLNQLGTALMQHADEFFWKGKVANARMSFTEAHQAEAWIGNNDLQDAYGKVQKKAAEEAAATLF